MVRSVPVHPGLDVESAIADVTERLTGRFSPALPGSVVEATVRACAARLQDVRVKDFVPLLVERRSLECLRGLASESAEADQCSRLASWSARQVDTQPT